MMCYKDMTFCKEDKCKKWDECHRALTDEVKEDAAKWWGDEDYPICAFKDEPDCFE